LKRISEKSSIGDLLGRHARAAALLVILLAGGIVHVNCLDNGFVSDDRYLVVENLERPDSASWLELFTKPWGAGAGTGFERKMNRGYYRPLTMILIRAQNAVFGDSPAGYHAVNIALHLLVCALVFLVAARWLPTPGAFAAGLVFAVHAVHTEPVNVIFYQTTLLVSLIALVSLWIMSRARSGPGRTAVVVGLFVVALLCKESAIVIPGLLLLHEIFLGKRSLKAFLTPLFLILAAVGIAYLTLRFTALEGQGFSYFEDAPLWSRALTMAGVFALYLRLLAWPFPLCVFYEWTIIPPVEDPLGQAAVVGVLAVAAYAALVVWTWRRARGRRGSSDRPDRAAVAGFALLFFPVSILHVMHVVPILNVAAERFIYLGSFAYCLLLGLLFQRAVEAGVSRFARMGAAAILGIYVILLAAISVQRNGDWRTDETLCRSTIGHYPQSLSARVTLTEILLERGQIEEALHHAEIARRVAPWSKRVEQLERTVRAAAGAFGGTTAPGSPGPEGNR